MPITLNHSNISVQYSSDKSYIIETVKSDLYRKNDNIDTIIRNNIQTAPVIPATYVDGGNVYAVESYTYSGSANTADYTRIFTTNTTCDILVVGGGGGGGFAGANARAGGGGGAGQFLLKTSYLFNSGTYNIKIGKGGLGGTTENGETGKNSSISTVSNTILLESSGGGGGARGQSGTTSNGLNGASGGGGCGSELANTGSGGTASTQFVNNDTLYTGYNGASGGPVFNGGGGGGYTSAGFSATTINGGDGGSGITNNITGVVTNYCAGGGGGAYNNGISTGTRGGNGGNITAGNGGNYPGANGGNATNGSGSGGGGAGVSAPGGSAFSGGAGGSGIVIIRYLLGTIPSNNILTNEPTFIAPAFTETIRTFAHSGGTEDQTTHTITVAQNTICDILIVGGGGSGGEQFAGGGGGGGGLIYYSTILNGTYSIKVGDGGKVQNSDDNTIGDDVLQDGKDSSISQNGTNIFVAKGGGKGLRDINRKSTGGSGGGGGYGTTTPTDTLDSNNIINGLSVPIVGQNYNNSSYPSGQGCFGNIGGKSGSLNSPWFSGGGGGAGSVGGDGTNTTGTGTGGSGKDMSSIFGTTFGINGVFAGGGGGYNSLGGSGGGGGGQGSANFSAGINGTGGGGGGSGSGTSGKNGGSGIVIIKFKSIVNSGILDNAAHKRLNFVYNPITIIPNNTLYMTPYKGVFNTTYVITITGVGNTTGELWGTDIYTDDSSISRAAVHAGVIQNGETKTLYIKMFPGLQSYTGTTRNTIVSASFGAWTGSYIFIQPFTNAYTVNFQVPTIADLNNNSNIVLRGAYDIALSTSNAIIIPKAGQHIPKPTTFTNYAIERMYPPVRNFTAGTTTVSGQTYGNGIYVVSYSSTFGSSYDPFKCFNTSDVIGGAWAASRYTDGIFNSTSFIVAGYLGDWLKIQLPVAIKLTRFSFLQRIVATVCSPKDFKIYGSNDNITWVELVNKTDTIYNASNMYEQTTPEIKNTYSYYCLVVNKIFSTGTNLNFDEWYIYGQEQLNPQLSIRYHLLNPTLDPIGAQWTYSSNNTNVYHMGSVGIGTTSPEYHFDVRGAIYSSTGGYTSSTLTKWSVLSDRRIKENIVKASYDKCLENVKNIELYNFNFKDNCVNTNDRHQLGFIAQEVQQVYPKAVEVGKMIVNLEQKIDDLLTLNITQIDYTLYGAVKSLIEKIENIKIKMEHIKTTYDIP